MIPRYHSKCRSAQIVCFCLVILGGNAVSGDIELRESAHWSTVVKSTGQNQGNSLPAIGFELDTATSFHPHFLLSSSHSLMNQQPQQRVPAPSPVQRSSPRPHSGIFGWQFRHQCQLLAGDCTREHFATNTTKAWRQGHGNNICCYPLISPPPPCYRTDGFALMFYI